MPLCLPLSPLPFMASFEGNADILSASLYTSAVAQTPKEKPFCHAQNDSSCLGTIYSLFPTSEARRDEQPPAKRRKVDDGNAVAVCPAVKSNDSGSVVLLKVSLHLSMPAASHEDSNATYFPTESQEPILLELESIRKEPSQSALHIELFNVARDTGVDIVAATPAPFLHTILPHLHNAATLATTRRGKKSKSVSRAAFNRCRLHPPVVGQHLYKLEIEIRWTLGISVVEEQDVRRHHMNEDLKLLSIYMGNSARQDDKTWTLSDFYDSVHVPPRDLKVSPRIGQALVETSLLPFQERTVDWLLRREGVRFSPTGIQEPFVSSSLPASFRSTQDAAGRVCYKSQLRGLVVTDLAETTGDALQSLKGGILAEEMGLGKTVELIALMSLHKRKIPQDNVYDAYTGAHVKPSGATLIITPPSILEQWISEMHVHAPELKVCHYMGLPRASAPKERHAMATIDFLMQHDVVVTTYQVLSREIHHAIPPPDRSSRRAKRHERRSSPLMGISWWRVCLDEAQMIETGVSQAAKVARMIPRCNAWAVSGTPLRKDVQDLRGLLVFLRCDAYANNKAVWGRLDKVSFKGIFHEITLRNTKDRVRDELQLPPQKRIVITVPFTTIEEQHYDEMMRQMCDACWLTPEGKPLEEGRDLEDAERIERMREWLVRLRQTCLHANVGRKNRKALGTRHGALRTVLEVLEVMIEQNDTKWKAEAREMILCLLKQGHIQAYAGNFANRAKSALPYYSAARAEAQSYIALCRTELAAEEEKLGRTSAAENDEADMDNMGRIPVLRRSLRSFLELEHAAQFFTATAFHQMKEDPAITEPGSEDWHEKDRAETNYYEAAKVIRHELLRESKNRAKEQMEKVNSKKPFHQIPKINDLPDLGGIEARRILDTMDNISDYLNAQAEQIHIWRSKIVEILLTRLMDDDDDRETTGEEYDESLKAQDELYVYIMALRTLVADRHAAVQGLQDPLTEHEMKAAEKQALNKGVGEDRGHAPELVIEVANVRRKLKGTLQTGSLKGVASAIRSLITSIQWKADTGDIRAASELSILQEQLNKVQATVTEQSKAITELEKEQEMYRTTMNQRLEYYRQFQHISDTVAKYKEDLDKTFDVRAFNEMEALRAKKKDSAAGFKAKCTYLKYLRSENQNDMTAECIICREDIEIGVLTACGHKYCKECINQWWHTHRSCPTCKQKLGSSDFKDISYKPAEIKAQEENPHSNANNSTQATSSMSSSSSSTPGSSSGTIVPPSIYADISTSTMEQIKTIDLDGSFGTKIDMIARHLLWIRANDPGAKSIIFTQFSDFFTVLREAFRRWKIGATSIAERDGIHRFKTDPTIECLLLDAKSDSSGLTLVNATYVFLCEPLINAAIELQAISRVHRIGQKRGTTVFMYLVAGTVEEAIYDISVKRRLEHISSSPSSSTKDKKMDTADSDTQSPNALGENTLDAANTAEVEAAPLKNLIRKKGDGEVVPEHDLWHCLFGKKWRRAVEPVIQSEVDRELRAGAAEARIAEADQAMVDV